MLLPDSEVAHLVGAWGYGVVAAVVALESMGLPLPGETVLVAAAVYAGTTGHLDIGLVVAVATAAAILGDNAGYWLGREFGYPLLLRHGHRVGLGPGRVKLGQYLFLRHGGKVVFLGRFVALLRILAAFLAGANRMPWRRFLAANACGAAAWAAVFGFGAFLLGDQARRLSGEAGVALLAVGLTAFLAAGAMLRRHHVRLEAEAERALPGPLPECHHWRGSE